jgi:hypothetical protein
MVLASIEQRSHNLFPFYIIFHLVGLLSLRRHTQNYLPHRNESLVVIEEDVGWGPDPGLCEEQTRKSLYHYMPK